MSRDSQPAATPPKEAGDSPYGTICYAVSNAVAEVTLARPSAMNAMTGAMRRELTHAFGRAATEARALLVTGAPPEPGGRAAFCAGQDLTVVRSTSLNLPPGL